MKKISEHNLFDHLFYIRLTEACNMDCSHCFIPANPKKMSINDCYAIPDVIKKTIKNDKRIILQWHGGEPTIFGFNRFKRVLQFVNEQLDGIYITNSIQTNIVNFNESWGELYRDYFNSRIGVSWDYKLREIRNGDFDKTFIEKVKLAHKCGLNIDLTITVASPFYYWVMSNPSEFFDFLDEVKPSSVHLEKITKTGRALENWDVVGITNKQYSEVLTLIYIYSSNWIKGRNDWFMGFSPLSDIEGDLLSLTNGKELQLRGCNSGICDSRFHTIDANGYKFGCTALTTDEISSKSGLGLQIITTETLLKVRAERIKSCLGCDFEKICNSGCITSTKIDESNECNGAFILRNNILNILINKKKNETISD